jgi:hypothetical protein
MLPGSITVTKEFRAPDQETHNNCHLSNRNQITGNYIPQQPNSHLAEHPIKNQFFSTSTKELKPNEWNFDNPPFIVLLAAFLYR